MRSRTLWLVVFGGIVALGLGAAVVAAFVGEWTDAVIVLVRKTAAGPSR